MQVIRLTTREIEEWLFRKFDGVKIPVWKIRRVIDDLEARDLLAVQRAATYRTVADADLPIIADELRRIGWLKAEAAAC